MFINKHEIIEQYIKGKLSGEELIKFQNELLKDQVLQSEVALQKELINSLQQFRKLQLKQRMDNIAVTSGKSYTGLKIAASIILAGFITYGVSNFSETKTEKKLINQSISPKTQQKNEQSNNLISKNTPNQIETFEKDKIVKGNNLKPVTNAIKPIEASINNDNEFISVNVPEVDSHTSDAHISKESNIALPKGEIAQGNNNNTLKAEVIVDGIDKSKFHYKYFNGKLYLYGEFDNPYELLEWNSVEGKKLYLKYKTEYYKIKNNQTEAVKLEQISDSKLLNELRQITK